MNEIKFKRIIREEIIKTLNEKLGINNMEEENDISISPDMNLGIISIPEN